MSAREDRKRGWVACDNPKYRDSRRFVWGHPYGKTPQQQRREVREALRMEAADASDEYSRDLRDIAMCEYWALFPEAYPIADDDVLDRIRDIMEEYDDYGYYDV